MLKEYGGYLPLELREGKEYYKTHKDNTRYYNCGRTAIYAAAKAEQFKQIHIPYYICDTVNDVLKEQGIEVFRYHINKKMLPRDLTVQTGSAVLLVNYFGLLDKDLEQIQKQYDTVLIDCTQAFFCPPILRKGVSNIYSCRKFIGVADGAYLIADNCRGEQLEPKDSWSSYLALCKSHEQGTNAAYMESLENEKRFQNERSGMSKLTEKILKSVDYELIKQKRRNNFAYLEQSFGEDNRLGLSLNECVPYLYPYWVKDGTGYYIKAELIKKRIYIPTLWKECVDTCVPSDLEYQWANDLVCLPIDQRYDINDMREIVNIIKDIERTVR